MAAADYWNIVGEPTTGTKQTAYNYFEVEKVREFMRNCITAKFKKNLLTQTEI